MFKACDKTSYRNKQRGSRGSWEGKRGAALVEIEGVRVGRGNCVRAMEIKLDGAKL